MNALLAHFNPFDSAVASDAVDTAARFLPCAPSTAAADVPIASAAAFSNSVSPDAVAGLCHPGEIEPAVTLACASGESSSCGNVESKVVSGWSRRPPEHVSRSIPPSDGLSGDTGQDALAGIAQAVKSAQPTVSNGRIPEKPETAYATDGQVAGVAPGPHEALPWTDEEMRLRALLNELDPPPLFLRTRPTYDVPIDAWAFLKVFFGVAA